MNRDRFLFALGLLLAIGGPLAAVFGKERLLRQGRTALLELAPRDPRSLMQGDYMDLDYALARRLAGENHLPAQGRLVVRLDARGVASFQRLHHGGPLVSGELLLRYRRHHGRVKLGAESFFFQEGEGPRYTAARYGELRLGADGTALLAGLRDGEGRPLGTPRR